MRAISRAALGILLVALCVSTSSCASEIILSAGRVVRIILNPLSATIRVGNRISVTAIPADSVGQPVGNASVTWSSSRTTVASVDAVGDVTGVSPGTATITASTGALSAALAVTVTDKNGNPVAGTLVRFTAPTSGPGGHFTIRAHSTRTVRVRTNADGIAIAPSFTTNRTGGGYTVTVGAGSRRAAFALVNRP